jgi:hypothetical protein
MDAIAAAGNPSIFSLLGRGVKQTREPNQRNADHPPIPQRDAKNVVIQGHIQYWPIRRIAKEPIPILREPRPFRSPSVVRMSAIGTMDASDEKP